MGSPTRLYREGGDVGEKGIHLSLFTVLDDRIASPLSSPPTRFRCIDGLFGTVRLLSLNLHMEYPMGHLIH